MKLSSGFPLQHSLLAATALAALTFLPTPGASAQDQIVLKSGAVQQVKITGVTATGVMVQVGAGTTAIPFSNISSVVMAPPAEFVKGMEAYEAKNFASAAASLNSVVQKYRGLPAPWAQQAAGAIGGVYLAMNDLPKAEQAYAAFQKAYPGQGGIAATVGMARIAIAKKDFAGAKQKLAPVVEKALAAPGEAGELEPVYSQAFLAMGQAEEQAGNFPAALQNYLRTVTLFYKDNVAVADAQEHADALRKAHAVVVP